MRLGSRILRSLVVATLTAATALVVTAPSAGAEHRAGCFQVGAERFADFRAQITRFGEQGKLSPRAVAAITCDPRTADDYVTYDIRAEKSGPAVLASGCKASTLWTITFALGGVLGGHRQSLNWCWNTSTHRVSDYGGQCSGYVTGWGTANGWSFEGCTQNDFIPYTLNGYTNGGVHHSTQGHFDNLVPWSLDRYLRLSIWGHYDGTCDTKYNNTIRHYC